MKKLSTGEDSTLGNYKTMAESVFGSNSGAIRFLDKKIKKEGKDAEVLADEGQMIQVLIDQDQKYKNEPIIVKKFKSAGEMAEWLSRARNISNLKRKYPPEEGYSASINLIEKRVEIKQNNSNSED